MLKPFENRLIVEDIKEEEVSSGGIICPELEEYPRRIEYKRAKVISVGEGKKTKNGTIIPLTVKPGDVIFYKIMGVVHFKYEGTIYVEMTEDNVLAVLEE